MATKILCVIDVQNDFITGSLRNEEAIKNVVNIARKIRNFKGDYILVTKDTHGENYLETKEGSKLPVEHCIYGSEGWEIELNVLAALEDAKLRNITVIYFEKPTFGSINLMKYVADIPGDLEIEVCGYCTDVCVISNTLLLKAETYDRSEITVDATCCAGVTPESHKAALLAMKMCQVNVINE